MGGTLAKPAPKKAAPKKNDPATNANPPPEPDKASQKLDWAKANFRFTVTSPEGKQVKVAIVPWPQPVAASGGDAAPAGGTAAGPTAAKTEKPDPTALKNPQWVAADPNQGARFEHGENAQMKVEAPGHDGKKVKFIVEQRIGNKWQTFQAITGVVKNGVAQARVKAQHPQAGKKGAPAAPHVLRFRNVFI
ncbi:MAG TPA: hypothetical protein VLW85_15475 [Myxococcales bacterium]|nr:hypothetical protein [Myxococcales bacterium]